MVGITTIAEAKKAIEEVRDHPARILASHANHPDDKIIKAKAVVEINVINEILKILEEIEKSARARILELGDLLDKTTATGKYPMQEQALSARILELKEVLGE